MTAEHAQINTISNPLLSNRSYDLLKRSATILLPAAGALYFALAQIWGLPNAEQVVGTIAAVNVFVGAMVSVSTRSYNNSDAKYDGSIDVTTDEDMTKTFLLHLDTNPDALETKKQVLFRVNSQ